MGSGCFVALLRRAAMVRSGSGFDFFFFQAEDGIRDLIVTGVQTCALPIYWLMPIMDAFRKHWPEVELDLVSGFHPNPLALLADNKTDLVIGSENKPRRGIEIGRASCRERV